VLSTTPDKVDSQIVNDNLNNGKSFRMAPWDERLLSVLSTTPDKLDSQIVTANLNNRKSFRMKLARETPNEGPLSLVPPSGEWLGSYQDMPCIANEDHKITYKITFRADGAVEGSCSSKDGEFNVKGVYNRCTGIVAWGQIPANPRPNARATEFYGDVSSFTTGPAKITGTFLTSTGHYGVVNLVGSGATTYESNEVAACCSKLRDTSGPRHSSATPTPAAALPTILTGNVPPFRAGTPSEDFFIKGTVRTISSYVRTSHDDNQ